MPGSMGVTMKRGYMQKREKALGRAREAWGSQHQRQRWRGSQDDGWKMLWSDMCDPLTMALQFISQVTQLPNCLRETKLGKRLCTPPALSIQSQRLPLLLFPGWERREQHLCRYRYTRALETGRNRKWVTETCRRCEWGFDYPRRWNCGAKFDNISKGKKVSAISSLRSYMKYFHFPRKYPTCRITKAIPVPGIL